MSTFAKDDVVEAAAGAIGAMCALVATYPLITLNTRQHVARRGRDATTDTDAARGDARERWRRADVKSMYDGIEPALVGTVASQTVYNYFYARGARARAAATGRDADGASSLMIASGAGILNVLMTLPIWTLVTKMQADVKMARERAESDDGDEAETRADVDDAVTTRRRERRREKEGARRGFFDVARDVMRESGVRGFWQGLTPSLVMVANPALQYAFYESAAQWRMRQTRKKSLSALEIFALGATAKFGATMLTYPLLVVKTRLQVVSKDMADDRMRYRGAVHAIRSMAEEEGLGVFYKGIETKLTQTILAAALMFTVKEKIAENIYKARSRVAARV